MRKHTLLQVTHKNVWVVRLSKYEHGTFYNEKTHYLDGIVRAVAAF